MKAIIFIAFLAIALTAKAQTAGLHSSDWFDTFTLKAGQSDFYFSFNRGGLSLVQFAGTIDSGKVTIVGDTVSVIRFLARRLADQTDRYYKEVSKKDSIVLLAEKVFYSASINGNDSCAGHLLKKRLRAFSLYVYHRPDGYILHHGPVRECCKTCGTSKAKKQ